MVWVFFRGGEVSQFLYRDLVSAYILTMNRPEEYNKSWNLNLV